MYRQHGYWAIANKVKNLHRRKKKGEMQQEIDQKLCFSVK